MASSVTCLVGINQVTISTIFTHHTKDNLIGVVLLFEVEVLGVCEKPIGGGILLAGNDIIEFWEAKFRDVGVVVVRNVVNFKFGKLS